MHMTVMPLDFAMSAADRVLRDMGRTRPTDKERSVLARELQRMHSAGRSSMYLTIAAKLDLQLKENVPPAGRATGPAKAYIK